MMITQPLPAFQGLAAALHAATTLPKAATPRYVSLCFKPRVARHGQPADETPPRSSKPLLPHRITDRGVVLHLLSPPGYRCVLHFTALISSAPSYYKHFREKLQARGRACGVAVEGLVLGLWKQGGLKERSEGEWPRAPLLLQGFILHQAAYHEGFPAQAHDLPPWFFPISSPMGCWGF